MTALERPQQLEQFHALRRVERRRVAGVVQGAVRVVQPEEQRRHPAPLGRDPVAADHAVGGPDVLDLDHHPLAMDVVDVGVLGDHAVEARPLESLEPRGGELRVIGLRSQHDAGIRPEHRSQRRPAIVQR